MIALLRLMLAVSAAACANTSWAQAPSTAADVDPLYPAKDFVWPKALFKIDPSKFVEAEITLNYDGAHGLTHHRLYYIDLNDDGTKEIIASLNPKFGATWGIFYLNRSHRSDFSDRYGIIGKIGADCSVLPKWHGFYQLESRQTKSKDGTTSRILLRCGDPEFGYIPVREEIYKNGVLVSAADLDFID